MRTILTVGALAALTFTSSVAMAGQPERPGAFGRDRSTNVKALQADPTSPGASEWGHEAARRGSTNGQLNQDWKLSSGGAPTKGKPAK